MFYEIIIINFIIPTILFLGKKFLHFLFKKTILSFCEMFVKAKETKTIVPKICSIISYTILIYWFSLLSVFQSHCRGWDR